MHMKYINNRMQDLKKQKVNTQQSAYRNSDDKQNTLINKYEQKQVQKKNNKKHLQDAQKLIMKQRLKQIVADNVQYFRNILQAKQVYRPNSHTLKLPGKVVATHYQSDYLKKKQYQSQNSSIDLQRSHPNQTQNCSQSKLPFKTTYQNEFKNIKEIKLKDNRKSRQINQLFKRSISNNAPTFLDTHNSLQYRNWGTGSVMPSMKPSPKVATTDIPFKANSMYRTDFHNVVLPRTQLVTHEETFPHSVDLWMGKSSYEVDFNKKKMRSPGKGYKPQQNSGATNLPFKSSTQYKECFIQSKNIKTSNGEKYRKKAQKILTNQDIQNLVMNL